MSQEVSIPAPTVDIVPSIRAWATSVTGEAPHSDHSILAKVGTLQEFFRSRPSPQHITSADVQQWMDDMKAAGTKSNTIYQKVGKLSSYYKWLGKNLPGLGNPCVAVRPKRPQFYQDSNKKAWTIDEMRALLSAAKDRAGTKIRREWKGNLNLRHQHQKMTGIRDYAMLVLALTTGMRRAEFCELMCEHVEVFPAHIVIASMVKGGRFVTRRVDAPETRQALVDYMEAWGAVRFAAGRRFFQDWRNPGEGITSQAFDLALRKMGVAAGIGHVHIHQSRHTAAKIVADATGSLSTVQEFLGHSNLSTTRIYVDRITIRKDQGSAAVTAAMKLP